MKDLLKALRVWLFKFNPQPVVQVKTNADREWLTSDAFPIVILLFSTNIGSFLERDGHVM